MAPNGHPLVPCGMHLWEGRIEVRGQKCACLESLPETVPLGQRFHLSWRKARAVHALIACGIQVCPICSVAKHTSGRSKALESRVRSGWSTYCWHLSFCKRTRQSYNLLHTLSSCTGRLPVPTGAPWKAPLTTCQRESLLRGPVRWLQALPGPRAVPHVADGQ